MKNFPSTDQDYHLWWLILHMRRAMHKVRARELFQYGITPEQAAVLFIVQAIGPRATPAEISRWLLRESHSTFGLLSRMEKQGLLRRTKDLEKKNLVRVTLTKKGREVYHHSTKRESIHRIVASLSEGEHQQLMAYLEKLWNSALDELGISRKPSFLSSE